MEFKLNNWVKFILPVFALFILVGCGDDEATGGEVLDPISSFQFEIDDTNFLTVAFTSFSQNATEFDWDFGDGGTSTEESPTYTYAAPGDYTVTLTATNADGVSAERSETIMITDPNSALRVLTGTTSKTWKLYREGVSMSLGPDPANPALWWAGLTNDGSRPCLYQQEITFGADGSYTFNDNGGFWAEFGVFNNVDGCDMNITAESCFDATPGNMRNACGDDVSAWLSGTHSFDYDPSTGALTLTGEGAWIGIPKLGTAGETITPLSTLTTQVSIEENVGFDVMLVEFFYGSGTETTYWSMRYASYSDASLEPALVTVATEFGEDLPDASPDMLWNTFMDAGNATLDTIFSGSTVVYGVEDPADATALCGQFNRTEAQFQELQFQTSPMKNDINFENLSSVSVEVYIPSSNDFSGPLTSNVFIGLADRSRTEQWWTDLQQYEMDGANIPMDEWTTVTFDLNSPNTVSNPDNGATPFERNDYDMVFLQIGGGNHTVTGTFYVRNLIFE